MKLKVELKIISLSLALGMCFSSFTSTAFAATVKNSNAFATEIQKQLKSDNKTSLDHLNKMAKNIQK